ncbi:hypothetical protein CEXT_363791 [Caerostris extrusa]|uniref:Uncharacterized protein n=1 Tax=Caerostris extrusa TaxID=172846 RepID=A0AAV4RCJ0_CAEEX|nr:hypothetical protein CEXT_363791 [Caerostris extrusa]
MGQLTDGEESLSFYNKGIQVLQKELENAENINPSEDQGMKNFGRSLSEAYCSVAEIYMTDCCFAENSEENCFSAIENSIQSDPSNPEAYHCLANFHLVKEQFDEAKEAVKKSLALWLPHHESLRDEAEYMTN